MKDMLDWAKFYTSKGFSVIPIKPQTKEPSIKWKKYQQSKPSSEELEQWFEGKNPKEVGIAVVLGISNFIAIDIDKPEVWPLFFDETSEELAEKTWVSKTSKGFHVFFRYRGKSESIELRGVVELKAKGRYVVVPPSIHPTGDVYQWLTNIEEVDVDWIKADKYRQIEKTIELLRKYWNLIEILLDLWREGVRHDEALAIAGLLRKARIPKRDALWIIEAVAKIKDDEELKDRLRAVEDTYKKPLNEIAGVSKLREILKPRLGEEKTEEVIARIKEAIGSERASKLEERELQRIEFRVSGKAEEGYYEVIEYEGRLCFLVYNGKEFRILDEVHVGDKRILPPSELSFPYEPYGYFDGEINPSELAKEVKQVFDTFIDAEEKDKLRWTIEIFHSYVCDLQPFTPYELIFGDEECGKTQTCTIFSKLAYRPLFGQKLTGPNVYIYLHHQPNSTIIIDNAEDLDRDRDLADILREGYKKGAVVPRTFETGMGEREQIFYPCYGFKVCAARRVMRDRNLMTRFITANMYEGFPEKDEFNEEDLQRFRQIRNKLLKWRLLTLSQGMEDIKVDVRGRLKELWKPLLRVAKTIGWGYNSLLEQMRDVELKRKEDRRSDVNYAVVNAVLYAIGKHGDDWIPFESIWEGLVNTTEGETDSKRFDLFHSEEYGDITKRLVGERIKSLFNPERRTMKIGGKATKCYRFSKDRVLRVVRRYICDRVTKLLIKPIGEYINREESHLVLICPHYNEAAENDCSLYISCPIGSIGNTVTIVSSAKSTEESGDIQEEEIDMTQFDQP